MVQYNFDVLPNRRKTESVKWRRYPEDVLPMWVADMDFVSPEPVIRALQERVAHGVFGYPDDFPNLRRGLVERMAGRYGWQIRPDDLLFLPGVVNGFNRACRALAAPGEGALVQTPVYPPMLSAPANSRLVRQEMALTRDPDGSYSVDWEAFEAAITPETRVFLLCNPHNPVGKVFQRGELERTAEICLRHGVKICADEIHSDLTFSGQQHIPIASLSPEIAAETVTLIAPSKTYNLAGLQCSVAIIQNPDLRRKFEEAYKGMETWVNILGMVAAEAAYCEGQEWLDQLLFYLEANRDYTAQFVQESLPGVEMGTPEGTYLAWLDCRKANLQGSPAQYFLRQARVALNDGETFGRGGEGFVRLNFGCPQSMLAEALERMQASLAR